MTLRYIPITLNCLSPDGLYGWQSVVVQVPERTTHAQLADLVGTERICPYDDMFERIPPGEGWNRSDDVLSPRYSYHVVVPDGMMRSLRNQRGQKLSRTPPPVAKNI